MSDLHESSSQSSFFLEGASWNYTEQQGLHVTSNSEDDEGPGF